MKSRYEILDSMELTVATAATLMDAIKRVALLSSGDFRPITVGVNNTITFSARSDLGEAREEVAGAIEGEIGTVVFSSGYLLQGLAAMEAEKVDISFAGPLAPVKITPADGKENAVYVLLPIRTPAIQKEAAGG